MGVGPVNSHSENGSSCTEPSTYISSISHIHLFCHIPRIQSYLVSQWLCKLPHQRDKLNAVFFVTLSLSPSSMRYPHLLLLLPAVQAFQLPFHIPKFFSSHVISQPEEPLAPTSPRIAIIGAGAGGSSAAFWIAKAKERFGLDLEIDVYESSDYIGGREYSL